MADGDSTGPGGGQASEGLVAAVDRLVTAIEEALKEQRKPQKWLPRNATTISVLVSAGVLCATILFSVWQLNASSQQFDQTLRRSQYAEIVNGLASSSIGVQVNSIRRLRQYVADPANYADDPPRQQEAAENAAQTLAAFIEDESTIPDHEGLSDYRDPYPVVVSRAMRQLIELTTPPEEAGTEHFPDLAIDLSRGNFHGVPAASFEPEGPFRAVGADFRGATVTDWELSAAESPTLASAFFTCANLQTSDLGTADVAAADFTGANLRGADLSGVQNLSQQQLRGALVGEKTELPADIDPPRRGWGITQVGETFEPSARCKDLMDRMTNLLAGAGYSRRIPCPGEQRRWTIRLSTPEESALERACRLRASPRSGSAASSR